MTKRVKIVEFLFFLETVDLPQHKYLIIEECLYYFLSQEADKLQEKPNSLVVLPPTKKANEKIEVAVEKMIVRQLWINELWKEMHVSGFFQMVFKNF